MVAEAEDDPHVDPHDIEVVMGMTVDCKTAYGSAAYGCEHHRSCESSVDLYQLLSDALDDFEDVKQINSSCKVDGDAASGCGLQQAAVDIDKTAECGGATKDQVGIDKTAVYDEEVRHPSHSHTSLIRAELAAGDKRRRSPIGVEGERQGGRRAGKVSGLLVCTARSALTK